VCVYVRVCVRVYEYLRVWVGMSSVCFFV